MTLKAAYNGVVTAVHNRWLSMNCFLKTQWALTGIPIAAPTFGQSVNIF